MQHMSRRDKLMRDRAICTEALTHESPAIRSMAALALRLMKPIPADFLQLSQPKEKEDGDEAVLCGVGPDCIGTRL